MRLCVCVYVAIATRGVRKCHMHESTDATHSCVPRMSVLDVIANDFV